MGKSIKTTTLDKQDKVWLDWARLQIDLFHCSTVRVEMFVFANTERRNVTKGSTAHDFVFPSSKVKDLTVPTMSTEIDLYPLTKSQLLGSGASRRHIGLTDGPFSYSRDNNGELSWKSSDETAWNAVLARTVGQPVGDISLRTDGGPSQDKGAVAKFMLSVASEQGSNMRYRHLDFFIRVGW
jgi:hypothetical protein